MNSVFFMFVLSVVAVLMYVATTFERTDSKSLWIFEFQDDDELAGEEDGQD